MIGGDYGLRRRPTSIERRRRVPIRRASNLCSTTVPRRSRGGRAPRRSRPVTREHERPASDPIAVNADNRQMAELRREDLLALVDISRELASETHLPRLLHRI